MRLKDITLIAAVAENLAVGINNQLLCHLPDDLKMFKERTRGQIVVMGRNTWNSLPLKPLPGRKNVVITDVPNEQFEGAIAVNSIDAAYEEMRFRSENFVIGGAMVYKQFLPMAKKLYITRIHHNFIADAFFPVIDFSEWKKTSSEYHPEDERHPYAFTFEEYKRITS
jgi:dihydrofolate reductase